MVTSKAIPYVILALLTLPLSGNAAIVQNGSFENPMSTWVNSSANYMAVANGSTAITGWAVANANRRGVAWAQSPTTDGYVASAGSYFVDLSGFGAEAGPSATLAQELRNLIAGATYSVGIDYRGDRVTVAIGGSNILTAAAASDGWTHLTTTFQASGAEAVISIGYIGMSSIAFVDNLTVTEREHVPAPGSLILAVTALLTVAGIRRRIA